MADDEPQPAKKQRVERRVRLDLPAEVVVPIFYKEERDATIISAALQLGANAASYLRSPAAKHRLEERRMLERSDLIQGEQELKLSDDPEKGNREVEQLVAEKMLAVQQTVELHHVLLDNDVQLFKSALQKLRKAMSANLETLKRERKIEKQHDSEVDTDCDDERQKADADMACTSDQSRQSQMEYLKNLLESLTKDGEEQQTLVTQLLKGKKAEITLLEKRLREAQDQGLVARSNSHKRGAVGEITLCELIKDAFGMAQDFELRDTSHEDRSGDLMARIFGLQTMWDSKNYSRTVQTTEVEKIKRDLNEHPEVDIAFLVSLQSNIACHTKHVFEVELLPPCQTLVYVNRLMHDTDPVGLLRAFVRPLLGALLRAKQAYAARRAASVSDLTLSLPRWVANVTEQMAELNAEQKELTKDRKQCDVRFQARQASIKSRQAALKVLLEQMNSCS